MRNDIFGGGGQPEIGGGGQSGDIFITGGGGQSGDIFITGGGGQPDTFV